MKRIIFAVLMGSFLAGCATAPMPKKPSEFNRVPVNKTIPAEIQGGTV